MLLMCIVFCSDNEVGSSEDEDWSRSTSILLQYLLRFWRLAEQGLDIDLTVVLRRVAWPVNFEIGRWSSRRRNLAMREIEID